MAAVIATNEELMIAIDTADIVGKEQAEAEQVTEDPARNIVAVA
jgi:hypothetical protein